MSLVSGTVFIGDLNFLFEPTESTEVTETDLVDVIILPEILTSEPKSSTVGGVPMTQKKMKNWSYKKFIPPAGRTGGAVSVGGSGAESGAISENAITDNYLLIVQDQT